MKSTYAHIRWKLLSRIGLFIGLFLPILSFAQPSDSIFFYPIQALSVTHPSHNMEVDNEGNIILLDTEQSQLHKYFVATAYDSSITVGGKGAKEGFIHPMDMSIKNRQSLYILDEAERRLLLLNTNLRVVGQTDFLTRNTDISTEEEEEIYPMAFDVSISEEPFILNLNDNKVYKFNSFGEIEGSFGGTDYGEGSLYNPMSIKVSEDNWVYVSDTQSQMIQVYDYFGVYRYKIEPETASRWEKFVVYNTYLICFNKQHIYMRSLSQKEGKTYQLPPGFSLQDVCMNRNHIYLLGTKDIRIYAY